MEKKACNFAVSIILFYFFLINPLFIDGVNTTHTFTEIGTLAPTSSIINMQYVGNDLAFLLEINRGLVVYNITNPINCTEMDRYTLSYVHDIELDLERNLVYATATNGVNIFNYSNPNQIILLSMYHNYTVSTYIQLKGELLFVGAEECGLQIVNVSNPYEPKMISCWKDDIGDIGPIYVLDNYIFIGTRIPVINNQPIYIDMKILDISDPTNITYVSTVDTGEGYFGGVPKAYINNLAYFNDHDNGLKILNFTDPSDVSVAGIYYDGGSINDVEVINSEIAYLADDGFGLKVINCSNPKKPFLIGSHQQQWRTIRVNKIDNKVYLATLEGGVRILSSFIVTNETEISIICIISCSIIANIILLSITNKRKLSLKINKNK
ncbi:MAG: hypothetical protein FK731_15465 [Asgard group archaeon]|nr:hypothetical protein [Asgard group archaeon]